MPCPYGDNDIRAIQDWIDELLMSSESFNDTHQDDPPVLKTIAEATCTTSLGSLSNNKTLSVPLILGFTTIPKQLVFYRIPDCLPAGFNNVVARSNRSPDLFSIGGFDQHSGLRIRS